MGASEWNGGLNVHKRIGDGVRRLAGADFVGKEVPFLNRPAGRAAPAGDHSDPCYQEYTSGRERWEAYQSRIFQKNWTEKQPSGTRSRTFPTV